MTVKEEVLKFAKGRKSFTTNEVLGFLKNAYSRQYVARVLKELVEEGALFKSGSTRSAKYWHKANFREDSKGVFKKRYVNKGLMEHKVFFDIEEEFSLLKKIPENVHSIFLYAFSEMFNNAIEHSCSDKIDVEVLEVSGRLRFVVRDYGIGVFQNIMKKKKLKSELDVIAELLKGKLTTQPRSHSGEGIFFTSKVGELFVLSSFGYQLRVDNKIEDVFVEKLKSDIKGTEVVFEIDLKHRGHLNDVFERYYSDPEELAFDKTEILVKLYTMGTIYISRSQARRVLSRLENFKKVVLDFDKVSTVGQAFADEIFRVFKISHPEVEITPVNMNESVKFMVGRVAGV